MKKRKTSQSSSSSSSSSQAKGKKTAQQIMEARKQRNREHAKKSRQKKKSMESEMRAKIEQLKQENLKLRDQVYEMIDDKTDKQVAVDSMVQEYVDRSAANFVNALKLPENRMVDTTTNRFLQSLSNKLIASTAKADNKKSSLKKALAVVG